MVEHSSSPNDMRDLRSLYDRARQLAEAEGRLATAYALLEGVERPAGMKILDRAGKEALALVYGPEESGVWGYRLQGSMEENGQVTDFSIPFSEPKPRGDTQEGSSLEPSEYITSGEPPKPLPRSVVSINGEVISRTQYAIPALAAAKRALMTQLDAGPTTLAA